MTDFVMDCSVTISWCIEEEQTAASESLLNAMSKGSKAIVPALWLWEVNNVLLKAELAGRISAAKRHQQIALLQKLPILIDEDALKQIWDYTTNLAHKNKLIVYDASYLEIAIRKGLPLGSLDKHMRTVAKKMGIQCLPGEL